MLTQRMTRELILLFVLLKADEGGQAKIYPISIGRTISAGHLEMDHGLAGVGPDEAW